MSRRFDVVLLDIEGTTSPITFVRDVLFPFAIANVAAFVRSNESDPAIAALAAEVCALAPAGSGDSIENAFRALTAANSKATPFKALQGLVWRSGYETGTLRAPFFPDVAPAYARWAAAAVRIGVYSSGSEEAQRLFYRYATVGDLSGWVTAGYFDTRVGEKQKAESYSAIAAAMGVPPARVLFATDVPGEVRAARAAGMAAALVVREGNAPVTPQDEAEATAVVASLDALDALL